MEGHIKKIVIWFVVGMLVGAGALYACGSYFVKSPAKIATQTEQALTKDLLAKVGKLIVLPTGEEPAVATINDASALIKEQAFYKGSINGDVVLVFQKAARAIVYSPSRNIIINVGPITLQTDPQTLTKPEVPVATSTKTTTKK